MNDINTAEAYILMRLHDAEKTVERLEVQLESVRDTSQATFESFQRLVAAVERHRTAIHGNPQPEDKELWRHLNPDYESDDAPARFLREFVKGAETSD